MAPVVSVIIPYFNHAATIGRAIDSVFSQTYSNLELLIIDDGSEEKLPANIQGINPDRICIKRHDVNRGAAAARNSGIDLSKGRYVAFLDADDRWRPDKLALQLDAMTKSDLKACVCGFAVHRDSSTKIENYAYPLAQPLIEELVWGCRFGPGSTLVCLRERFDTVGRFDESLLRLEDWDWLLRFAENDRLGYVPSIQSEVYITKGGRAADHGIVREATRRIHDKHSKFVAQFGLIKLLKFLSTLAIENAAAHYRNGEKAKAALNVSKAICIWPFRDSRFFKRMIQCIFE